MVSKGPKDIQMWHGPERTRKSLTRQKENHRHREVLEWKESSVFPSLALSLSNLPSLNRPCLVHNPNQTHYNRILSNHLLGEESSAWYLFVQSLMKATSVLTTSTLANSSRASGHSECVLWKSGCSQVRLILSGKVGVHSAQGGSLWQYGFIRESCLL